MAKVEQSQGLRRFSGIMTFIIISASLWLIIKLSDTYTVTVPFAIHYVDIPASQLVQDNDQDVSATVTTSGFNLLNYYFSKKQNRKIELSLKDIKYKKVEANSYSFSSRYIVEKIAEFMFSSATDVIFNDDIQYFTMSRLASKKVKIVPKTNITFGKQFNFYGEPIAYPDSITIYGSVEDVNNTKEVTTKVITKKNVNQNIETKAKIDLNEQLNADIDEVEVSINVEKYTEAEMIVPISVPDNVQLHLYPNKVSVRYIVAMKDYSIINSLSFMALVDTTDMFFKDALPVDLVLSPNNTQIIGINPKEVEYIIVQQ